MNLKPANPSLSQAISKGLATSIKLRRPSSQRTPPTNFIIHAFSPRPKTTLCNLNKLLFLNPLISPKSPPSNFHISTPKMKASTPSPLAHFPSNYPKAIKPAFSLQRPRQLTPTYVFWIPILFILNPSPDAGKTPTHWKLFPHETSLSGSLPPHSFGLLPFFGFASSTGGETIPHINVALKHGPKLPMR